MIDYVYVGCICLGMIMAIVWLVGMMVLDWKSRK